MQQSTRPIPAITSAVTDYLGDLLRHALYILTFRHAGQGLAQISDRHLAVLALFGAAVTYLPPLASASPATVINPHWLPLSALVTLLFARAMFGVASAAGLALILIITEPGCALLRLLPIGYALDRLVSVWVLAANIVFFLKCQKTRGSTLRS